MQFVPKEPLFGWQFGKQTKVPADTPILSNLEAFADQNYVFWKAVFDQEDSMRQDIGWTEPVFRLGPDDNGGALNRVNASLISAIRRVDMMMGTDSRYHVSEELFEIISVSLPKSPRQLEAMKALGPNKRAYNPAIKLTVTVTCYGAFQHGEPTTTAFPTTWKIEPLACIDEKRCVPWEQFLASS